MEAVLKADMNDNSKAYDRDRRSMNHMDADTKAVHLRLEEWGQWSKGHEVHAWPSTTPMGRMVEEGPHGAGQASKPPVEMSERIAQVDAAVAKLGDIDKRVVKHYYVFWEPREVMARKMKMNVKKFENVLKRARWRISGYLSAQV